MTRPPTMPVIRPSWAGTPDATATPTHSGRATRKTTRDAVTSARNVARVSDSFAWVRLHPASPHGARAGRWFGSLHGDRGRARAPSLPVRDSPEPVPVGAEDQQRKV